MESSTTKPLRKWVVQDREYRLQGSATWRAAERWLCERKGWHDVDAATHDAVTPAEETVEIKSCRITHNGQYARLTIWDEQYWDADQLAVVVYADLPSDGAGVVAHGVVDMRGAVEYQPREQKHPTMGRIATYVDPRWVDVLELDDVRAGLRRSFVAEFDDVDDNVVVIE